jgi:acyl-CoA synthetase (NDP forming)/RimJ/RimL family protein N-acetyltransferase
MRPVAPSPPATDDPEPHRLVLRDGSTAKVRPTAPSDQAAMRRFFEGLSPEARYRRFFSAAPPSDTLIARFCDSSNPLTALTLIAVRRMDEEERIVAVASYTATDPRAAEVAFAVDERFQGKGVATLLLEQLAAAAAAHGFERFQATTFTDNTAMLQVFRESGFQAGSMLVDGEVDVSLTLTPSAEGVAAAEHRRRQATVASLRPLLAPRRVVVVGASNDLRKVGGRVLQSLKAVPFSGSLYVVNPHRSEVQGVASCRSARDLPAGIDLAIIAVPAVAVRDAVDDCAAAGVKSVVVLSAGFAEVGPDGRARQDALVDRIRANGMRLLGPNCMGLLNLDPAIGLNATFTQILPQPGRVAFSSQSGALGIALLNLARQRRLGFSSFVSVGNKADVSGNDLLEYWEVDPQTDVILMYLESFGNPRRFARIARRVARTKPVVALKAGRTAAASRAASSHTAAIAANDAGVDALFRQTGVIRVETADEMFDVAQCLDRQPLPAGRRLAIVTNAGGPAILAADACQPAGLTIAALSPTTVERLTACLPATASIGNPIDMIAMAGGTEYERCVHLTLGDPGIDALLAIVTSVDPGRTDEIDRGIERGVAAARAAGAVHKPVLACFVGADAPRVLADGRRSIPAYAFPENAVRALGKAADYAAWRAEPEGVLFAFEDVQIDRIREICRRALATYGEGWLDASDTAELLLAAGLPQVPGLVTHSLTEATAFASRTGYPVAAKVASPGLHKTDLGLVQLDLFTPEALASAYDAITAKAAAALPQHPVEGILVQPMITSGVETIAGITHDPVFGPLVAFGYGGTDVEVWRDVQYGVVPVTDRDAEAMIRRIHAYPLLAGHRRREPADLGALRDVVLKLSVIAEEIDEIAELDLNPLVVAGKGEGVRVVDARIRVVEP